MAITFVNSGTAADTSGIGITLNNPASVAQNDVAVCVAGAVSFAPASSTNIATNFTTAGYTNVGSPVTINNHVGFLAWKVLGASPNAAVSFTNAGATYPICAVCLVFRGVDTTTPLDVTSTSATANTTNPDPPAIVPASNDCAIVVMASMLAGTADATPGTVSGYSTPVSVQAEIPAASASEDGSAAYLILTGNAGVSQNPAAWSSWASGSWSAFSVALRPAGQPYVKRFGWVKDVYGGYKYNDRTKMWRQSLGDLLLPKKKIWVPAKGVIA